MGTKTSYLEWCNKHQLKDFCDYEKRIGLQKPTELFAIRHSDFQDPYYLRKDSSTDGFVRDKDMITRLTEPYIYFSKADAEKKVEEYFGRFNWRPIIVPVVAISESECVELKDVRDKA